MFQYYKIYNYNIKLYTILIITYILQLFIKLYKISINRHKKDSGIMSLNRYRYKD